MPPRFINDLSSWIIFLGSRSLANDSKVIEDRLYSLRVQDSHKSLENVRVRRSDNNKVGATLDERGILIARSIACNR